MQAPKRFLNQRQDAIAPTGITPPISWIAALVRPTLTFCTITILSATAASAATSGVRAFAEVPDLSNPPHVLVDDTGLLFGQNLTTAQASSTGPDQDATAMARAQIGDVGVRVFASSMAPASGVTAEGQAQFFDSLQITSGTLPFGAPIGLQFSMVLDGTTTFTGSIYNGGPDSVIHLSATVNGFSHSFTEILQLGKAAQVSGSQMFTVDSTVGATLTLSCFLDVNARSGFVPGGTSALSDYLHTATFFAAPITPEISIVSSSGHDYSQRVPEQGRTAYFLGLGLVITVFERMKHQQNSVNGNSRSNGVIRFT